MAEETPPTYPPRNPAYAAEQTPPAYQQPLVSGTHNSTPNSALLTQATQPAQQPDSPAHSPMQQIPPAAQPMGVGVQITPQPGPYVAYPGAQQAKAPPYPYGAAQTPAPAFPPPTGGRPGYAPQSGNVGRSGSASLLWLVGVSLGVLLSLLLIANTLLEPGLARFGGVTTSLDAFALDAIIFTLCFVAGWGVTLRTGRMASGALVGLLGRGIASIVQFALYIITLESLAQRTGLTTLSATSYLLIALLNVPLRTAYDTGAATLGALVARHFRRVNRPR